MSEFMIGCTHFGHANIISLARRPFESVEEMDQVMIDNWNRVVGKRDTVYHLGDFAMGPGVDPEAYLPRLHGKIIRLQGNHDPIGWGENYMELRRFRRKIVLCHYPIEEWNGYFHEAVHFHCHTHKPVFVSAERRGNVGADAVRFTPIPLEYAVLKLGKFR